MNILLYTTDLCSKKIASRIALTQWANRYLLVLILGVGTQASVHASFTSSATTDTVAPLLTQISVESISANSAIVVWETDELADGLVEYGTTDTQLDFRSGDIEHNAKHIIILTQLSANTEYYFRVSSSDPENNKSISSVLSFTTTDTADTQSPILETNPTVTNITEDSATISWQTDEHGSSKILFDYTADVLTPTIGGGLAIGSQLFREPTASELQASTVFEGLHENHTVDLSHLVAGALYYYVIETEDIAGNKVVSEVRSFTAGGTPIDSDGDGTPDSADAFPFDASETLDSDGDGLGNNIDIDDNNNGIADSAEELTLPDLGSDDGFYINEPEANENKASAIGLSFDVSQPQIISLQDITVNSTGTLTSVELTGPQNNALQDSETLFIPSDLGPFRPGRHRITWQPMAETDISNTYEQFVDVIPMISFSAATQSGSEGDTLEIKLLLNGDAVTYPVIIPYSVAGTATSQEDHDLSDGEVVIQSGEEGSINLTLFNDSAFEGPETIEITINTPQNAVQGEHSKLALTINEHNTPPKVLLSASQDGVTTTAVSRTGGTIIFQASVIDSNIQDNHAYAWFDKNGSPLPVEENSPRQLRIDPKTLLTDLSAFKVVITDNGEPAGQGEATLLIRLLTDEISLSDTRDSDNDGITDSDEGIGDEDLDGIPNYIDRTSQDNLLEASSDGERILQTEPGLKLRIGQTAFSSSTNSAFVSMNDIENHGGENGSLGHNATDEQYNYPEGLIDFEIDQLADIGGTAKIVMPLLSGIPSDAIYRKYISDLGWQAFAEDTKNQIASAAGEPGVCPQVGDASYQPGLNEGHYCVQLTIEDGGANDTDGLANGIIKDPGGIATKKAEFKDSISIEIKALSVSEHSVDAGDKNTEMLRFQITTSDTGAEIEQLTLRASGNGEEQTKVKNVTLWLDSNQNGKADTGDLPLGGGLYNANNDRLITLWLDQPFLLPIGNTDFIVTYDF